MKSFSVEYDIFFFFFVDVQDERSYDKTNKL